MTEQWLIDNQIWIRLGFFIFALAIFGLWETFRTWRPWFKPRWQRWGRHLSLIALSELCIKLVFPILAVGVAILVEDRKIGVFNQIPAPLFLKVIIGVFIMDIAMYWQHRMLHKYSWLWRIHRVHHTDRQLDVTTGVRFHPLEMIFTTAVKIGAVAFFGVNVLAIVIFEIWLNFALPFAHVNVRLNRKTDLKLRRIIVTPGMHRIHHSDTPDETNSNYGFCLSIWDRLFKSYTQAAKTGEINLVLGLEEYCSPKYQTFENMLWMPFNLKSLRVRPTKARKLEFQTNADILTPLPKKGE